MEEAEVQPGFGEQYAKAVAKDTKNEFLKVRNARKASNGAGFSHIRPTPKTVNSAGAS